MTTDIVYVDDEPQPLLAVARSMRALARISDFAPQDWNVDEVLAIDANLWILDFFNDPPDPQENPIEHSQSNGMTAFQQLRFLLGDSRPPTVLLSNDLEAAIGIDVVSSRRHIAAEQLGVEWIAPKTNRTGDPTLPEMLAIADAVRLVRTNSADIRDVEATRFPIEFAHRILSLPRNVDWLRLAARDVAAWRPPSLSFAHEDHRAPVIRNKLPARPDVGAARSVVAWLIRQVLFYPSFLVSRRHVAARLGLTIACLDEALTVDSKLARKLRRMLYKGALADLVDARWWSAAIDGLAWSLPHDRAERTTDLADMVAPAKLAELEFVDPVVVSDADLVETDELAPAADCVRASDAHFPQNAQPAWIKIEDARQDRALARRVRLEDQDRLETEG